MLIARDFDLIRPGLSTWHAYDTASKADLFSTAIAGSDGTFLVDPIQLDEAPLARLAAPHPIAGIILTNGNHLRAVDGYARRFPAPVFAHGKVAKTLSVPTVVEVADGSLIGEELHVISLDGAGCGEIALYHQSGGGTLIVGDALIHFDPYGFALLPDKYCENPKQMRRSLQKLARFKAGQILFAHGLPILSKAHARLCALLDVDLKSLTT